MSEGEAKKGEEACLMFKLEWEGGGQTFVNFLYALLLY